MGLIALRQSLWDLPGPGIEPMSLALAGEFLTIGPPGKSYLVFFNVKLYELFIYVGYQSPYWSYYLQIFSPIQ